MTRLLIHVQYLKGIGHLQRTGLIAEAAAMQGLQVHIVSGGLPLQDLRPQGTTLHQLPAIQAGPGGFTDLRDTEGHPVDTRWLAERRDCLLDIFKSVGPDVLMVESFPFGRRAFAFELIPLLETASACTPRPARVCSIRDILQRNRKPGRTDETLARLHRHFDALLVHGDPAFAKLEDSFAAAQNIAVPVHYTGFVSPPDDAFAPRADTPAGEVIVSIGGGGVGPALLDAALDARPQTSLRDRPWRLLAGPNLAQSEFARLAAAAPPGVRVERFRDDFRRLLSAAALSISYAGYNTTLDILRTAPPAVLVSYSGEGGETEQAARASCMVAAGRAVALSDSGLSGAALTKAIARALAMPRCLPGAFDFSGAQGSANRLMELADARSSP